MSSYMKGYSKRRPYMANFGFRWGDRQEFWSAPVRHLLESLERESALEKPYLDGEQTPRRRHLVPGSGQVHRWWANSSYPIKDMWKVEYNKPECILDIRNLDCEQEPSASISIDYRAGWITGNEIYYLVSCDRPDLIGFGPVNYTVSQGGEEVASDLQGTKSDTYWSFASLQGKWLKDITAPFKMTCSGMVVLKGGWASSEIKRGTTVVTQSVLVQSSSATPGSMMVSGTNPITGARGTSVHQLSELGIDPSLASLAGHGAVTAAAQMYASGANTQGGQFNNYIANRPISDLSYKEYRERLDWFRTPGTITGWYGGILSCPAVEVDVSCDDEKCEDTIPVYWDGGTSAQTITAGGASVTVAVLEGVPPFTWDVSPEEFSLASRVTTGRSNTLTASNDACGAAFITVTDACYNSTIGAVRETGGTNTNWATEASCGTPDAGYNWVYGVTSGGYLVADDWCVEAGKTCDYYCTDTCPQLLSQSLQADDACWVEANIIYSWSCN